jgi:hypothetical protein
MWLKGLLYVAQGGKFHAGDQMCLEILMEEPRENKLEIFMENETNQMQKGEDSLFSAVLA